MRYMRELPAEHFHEMIEAAAAAGYEIGIRTAYRSYEQQYNIFWNYVARDGEEAANKYSARPGQSEHQTGLCADVTSPSVEYKLTTEYGQTPEGGWLAQNAHYYGFIIRYPLGKEDITGYQYEPWHVRYVGEAAATEIYEKELTLEEYLAIVD
jgi:zinc D-Ala-D-Ala carboxypeptidase